jgi:hypothetical protein
MRAGKIQIRDKKIHSGLEKSTFRMEKSRSGMEKSRSGIQDKHPGFATQAADILASACTIHHHTDKENKIFLINKEIQKAAVANI